MKNTLTICFALLFQCLVLGPVLAAVTGDCVNCHTMHNSQDGSAVAHSGTGAGWDDTNLTGGDSTASQVNLLVSGCVGCHSNSGSDTIVTIGTTKVPIVYNHSEPTLPLAGGNFFWVESSGDGYGHNVAGISSDDASIGFYPPGSMDSVTLCFPCHYDLTDPPRDNRFGWGVTNGGCEACHVPRHHANGTNTVVGQAEGWYRFLGSTMERARYDQMITSRGVVGIEDDDWEQTVGSNDHNVYQGAVNYGNGGVGPGLSQGAIGQICVGCHGKFHTPYGNGDGMTDTSGAWIRHPADVLIPDTGEYSDFDTYSPLTPVGVLNVTASDANFEVIDNSRNLVNCISCHRAHGSPNPDMLRWDYANECNTNAGANAKCGCFTCHTAKDGATPP